eukprot:gnl/TRDRNA2_/TRDRNA2_43291_c0_seq1.p1 gnl/TRDRNA2_/TRDRNA2_43291_c0~~gnl/TRDRNA2_/TRDRNA2_43291_c0_seq1.p1  ORF type:complete len:430 (+),score=125.49 gnl/TRDRNA2_/TRDRNA2_43291_c0_seq1:80-1369(+)
MPKKQPKKRAWRKADIADVEEALEDDRLVEKLKRKAEKGGTLDEELFTIDTAGSSEGLSRGSKREIARAKLFPPKGPNLGLTASEEFKIQRVQAGDANRQATASRQKRKAAESTEGSFDLWGSSFDEEAAKKAAKMENAPRVRFDSMPRPSKVPSTLHKHVGKSPAVLAAHEGQSMNPASEAHEDLMLLAASRQLEHEREEDDLNRKQRPITHELRDRMSAEEFDLLDEAAKLRLYKSLTVGETAEDEGDGEGAGPGSRPRKFRLKSQAFRNKQKRMKIVNDKEAQLRTQKQLDKSVGELGAIRKSIREKDQWEQSRREYRKELRKREVDEEKARGVVPKRRRLGRTKFAEEALVIPNAEAASKGMRGVPLRASAITDRVSSIIRRGLLPAPAEGSKFNVRHLKKKISRVKRMRKHISPLLRDNSLLLR